MLVYKNLLVAVGLFMTALAIAVVIGVSTPQNAAAGGGVGGGGEPGGCSGSCEWSTAHGYGFYKFPSNSGAGPYFAVGNWGSVSALCRNGGNDTVVAFIWQSAARNPYTAQVTNYDASSPFFADTPSRDDRYKGNDGGNWVTYATAKSMYDTIPAVYKSGYTWGSNVAWFCYNSANQWDLRGESYIQKGTPNKAVAVQSTITAAPGDRVNWYHDLRNTGPQDMDRLINYNVSKTGFSNGWNGTSSPQGSASGGAGVLFIEIYATQGDAYTWHIVTQNDVGNTMCQRLNWSPRSWNNSAGNNSGGVCATVPYEYGLTPQISNVSSPGLTEGATGTVPVTARVTNSGSTKSHTNIQWQLTQVKYDSGVAISRKAGGVSASDPCAYFIGNASCTSMSSGTESAGYSQNQTKAYNGNGTLNGEEVGASICYAMSVKRNSSASTDWRHSALVCLMVGKKPKVQVLGSDLIVGRGLAFPGSIVSTSVSRQPSGAGSETMYGSWAEYGIIPSGYIEGMGSASGYAGGIDATSLCGVSLLSFTNTSGGSCSDTAIGSYRLSGGQPPIGSSFPITASTPKLSGTVNIKTSLTPGRTYTSAGTTLRLTSTGQINPGAWYVINAPNATVTITGDIVYTNATLTSPDRIPQVVIIARNIIVADSVSQIDAWLVATGTGANGRINTCGAGGVSESTLPTSLQCTNTLRVNGPVIANHLILRRTAGAGPGTSAGDPAEIFNLRPDAYIWASNLPGSYNKARTVMTTELPPRF